MGSLGLLGTALYDVADLFWVNHEARFGKVLGAWTWAALDGRKNLAILHVITGQRGQQAVHSFFT
eukprot:scaffold832_cov143-Pinguiococcus_pyrenoidosus.AAC.1